ncbi:response regulator transcription factor [Cohnella lupini]|uniref:Two-component system response regulator YesN n=1 Tax=Cohnella lupini TaxID=1294267 RepID=A0A3D9ITE1_9BACL|nr:response regulator [Cohnella lupini]RED65022.1 two-component system response regulator YesN [Cohnella lupini]
MYRVLLVDDEMEVRSGLKLKIEWTALGFEVAGEAQDGREALALLENERYDLVLTDIRMPIMSGLELLKQCAENYPELKVIVLSGHDDFHYVKAAMQSGARDYLLKPVVRSELSSILGKLRIELDSEKQAMFHKHSLQHQLKKSHSVMQEQLVLEWIDNDDPEKVPSLGSEIHRLGMEGWLDETLHIRFLSVEIRVPRGRLGEREEGNHLFLLAFQLVCRETAEDPAIERGAFAFYHRSYPQMMHFLVAAPTAEEGASLSEMLCGQIQMHIHRYLKAEAVIGIGASAQGLASVRQGFLSAMLAWSQSHSGSGTQVVFSHSGQDDFAELFPEAEKRLTLALENGDLDRFSAALESVLHSGNTPIQGTASFLLRVILLMDKVAGKYRLDVPETQHWMFPDMLWKHRSEASVLAYLTGTAAKVIERIKNSKVSGGVEAVEAMRRYIDASYMNEISLTMLADRFHINPTYLSELFKKQTGSTFSEYIAQVRIGRAAELLQNPQLRLSDIAELVGFANASYLSIVFKKHYGVSPNEYRNHPADPPT